MCFTDGSKHDERAGAAATILWRGNQKEILIPLGTHTSVFQAEILAIKWAAEEMILYPGRNKIYIYSDSMSSLYALQTWQFMTYLVSECFESLKALALKNEVRLIWIPAHEGYEGNEQVDQLAKDAADMTVYGPEPIVPISVSTVSSQINVYASDIHKSMWNSYMGAGQTKELINLPSRRTSRYLTSLSRQDLRLFVQTITGHCTLQSHLYKIKKANTNICQFCETERETSLHFITRCDRFVEERMDYLEGHAISAIELRAVEPRRLMQYIISTGRFKPSGVTASQ